MSESEAAGGDGRERQRSSMAGITADRILVHGHDLTELMGRLDLGQMAFLEMTGRMPGDDESAVFNAMLVSLVEHGLTPNTLAARLTYLGAPEALQAAVAAGILGLGSVFVGTMEGAARMLQEGLAGADAEAAVEQIAQAIVTDHHERRALIPGIGHPIHRAGDPRASRLLELGERHGLSGRHVQLMLAVEAEAERQYGKRLPLNVTGAIGALVGQMGIRWQICRGLGIMARSVGLVAHLQEEMQHPIAEEIWREAE